jgi:UDP-glucose 6-dehydrogenase
MNVAIVGTGYVGLVTGACLAEFGFDTVCVDKNRQKIERLQRGILPIFELDRAREALGPAPIGYCRDVDSCVEGADVVAIVTDWPQYQSLHWPSVRTAMAGSAVVDFRNLCDPDAIVSAGLSYHGIGRRARGQRRNAVYSEAAA